MNILSLNSSKVILPAHFIGLIIYLFFVQDYEVSSTLLTKTKVDSTKQIMKYVKRLNKGHRTLRKEKKEEKKIREKETFPFTNTDYYIKVLSCNIDQI